MQGRAEGCCRTRSFFGAFATCSLCVPYLNPRLRAVHGFKFVFALALFQFCTENLGPLALVVARHESFSFYGFTWKRLGKSLQLGVLLTLLYDAGLSLHTRTLCGFRFAGSLQLEFHSLQDSR
jgi:hypothetical protein